MTKHQILSEEEIETGLKELANWEVRGGELYAELKFAGFEQAVAFINRIAEVAKDMSHHPKIVNQYNRVTLSLSTHDVGDKITDTDLEMARRINKIAV